VTAGDVGPTRLTEAETWHLLEQTTVGVLATAAQGRADLFPVNYLVDGRTLLIRTSPGTKTVELSDNPHAAFAAQGTDRHGAWSVVIQGSAEQFTDEVDLVGSAALELVSWAPGEKHVFVRITPYRIEGRRMARADLERPPRFT
jgi:hypothetical protein